MTEVEIDFFLPFSLTKKYYVETTHRGMAVNRVLEELEKDEFENVNYVRARDWIYDPKDPVLQL